jgi:phosphate transport system substrate-binding protein
MTRRIRLAGTAAILIPAALLAAACSSSPGTTSASTSTSASTPTSASAAATSSIPAAPSSGTLTETGSSVMFPLVSEWQKGYSSAHPGIKISTASTNSGTGITDAGQGLVNIGASDAYLSATQKSDYPTLENIPTGVNAIEVVYNLPSLTAPLNLSGTVLAQIYDGKMTRRSPSSTPV